MKGVGVERIGGEMFVKKHTAELKMRWKRQKAEAEMGELLCWEGGREEKKKF